MFRAPVAPTDTGCGGRARRSESRVQATSRRLTAWREVSPGAMRQGMGQIGDALSSRDLERISTVASWAWPSDALLRDGLDATVSGRDGSTGALLDVGPF